MKITYVVPQLYEEGGIQQFAKSIYSQLSKYYNIELINWKNILSLPEKAFLRFSPSLIASFYYNHFAIKKLRASYKEIGNADFVHFWHLEPAISFLDKKYIVSCHGREILPANLKGYRKVMYPKALQNAEIVHVNSNFTKNLVLKISKISNQKVKVITPPIIYDKFSKIKNKNKNQVIIIGTLTRFNKRKNIPNIIKALNILNKKYNLDFKYYLAGDGLEKKRIMKELKKTKFKWKYFGEISEKEKVKEFYPFLDVFVMPPLKLNNDIEGFGIVYLEANAFGIPVVASKTGGVSDAVKEKVSGIFADPTNPEDIAVKIKEVLENKEKYFNSAKNWTKQFDINKIAKEFTEVYREVLG